jgi:uncharacterized membrane protein
LFREFDAIVTPHETADTPTHLRRDWIDTLSLALALLAAIVAGYLLIASVSASGRPVGCGAGSGCDEVLSSRWSQVLGIPVGLPAMGLYFALAASGLAEVRAARLSSPRWVSFTRWIAAGAVLAAVAWFIGLQWIELQAFCPWCLGDHALGASAALLALVGEVRGLRFRPGLFAAGVMLTAMLAATQILVPGAGPTAQQLSNQQLQLLSGHLSITADEVPHLGDPRTETPVVLLFDYCCPHCRRTHAHLLELRRQHPGRFSLVLLPVPLNRECNPHVEETEERFQSACELARLALALWRVDRSRFTEFDQWLFGSDAPRSPAAARGEAERLVGAMALAAALRDPWIAERIRADVEAFQVSGVDAIPVLLAPAAGGVSGRVEDAAALRQVLSDQLHVAFE